MARRGVAGNGPLSAHGRCPIGSDRLYIQGELDMKNNTTTAIMWLLSTFLGSFVIYLAVADLLGGNFGMALVVPALILAASFGFVIGFGRNRRRWPAPIYLGLCELLRIVRSGRA